MIDAFVRASGQPPFVYGHRGMRGAPENTLPAFERALAAGADGIELDVRLCKSDEVAVMHDPDLIRMAQRDELVAELDYRELKEIDLGGGAYAPRLRDVLDLGAGTGARINVEIKSDVPDLPALVAAVARELAARNTREQERIMVSSFHPLALAELHTFLPKIAVAFLLGERKYEMFAPALAHYGLHPKTTLVDADKLKRYRKSAGFINVWTVNTPEDARRLSALGVDGIITDVPDVVATAIASSRG